VRWDNTDPVILYSTYATRFYKYNIVNDKITLLHDFKSDFPNEPVVRVYMAEEGDGSDDRRYWPLSSGAMILSEQGMGKIHGTI